MTLSKLNLFLSKNPYLLMQIEGYKMWEHPIHGDTYPIYMSTPSGRLINTGFHDLGDFDLDLCMDLESNELDAEK